MAKTPVHAEKPPELSVKQRAALEKRLARLELLRGSVGDVLSRFDQGFGTVDSLRLREGFAYRADVDPTREASDRSAPPREERPPASRLVSPRGGALRLELTALAAAQTMPPKKRPRFELSVGHPVGPETGLPRSWAHMLASPAVHGEGSVNVSRMDKRVRQARAALRTIASQGLGVVGDEFALLQEDALPGRSDTADYRQPRAVDPTFVLPGDFINNGWVHVLEDSEILLLLMVACRKGRLDGIDPEIAIPSGVRLLNYGIARDSYGAAHRNLKQFGLLDVSEVGRYDDGRVIDFGTEDGTMMVHRLALRPEGFGRIAHATVTGAIERWLAS